MITVNSTPHNSYHSYDNLQIYTNDTGVKFMALRGQEVKRVDKMPIDVEVIPSTKEAFEEELEKASTKSFMSQMFKELYIDMYK